MPTLLSAIGSLFSDSAKAKGIRGEVQTSFALSTLPSKQYHIFNDITLHTDDNATTQIDHIVISNFGVFVIEVKNYNGYIYGSEKQYKWTQTLNKNTKNQFLNPLLQNQKHLKTVQKAIRIDESEIFSIVIFLDKAEFKTVLPDNVLKLSQLKSYIKDFTQPIFSSEQCETHKRRLDMRKLSKGSVAETVHMKHIERKRTERLDKENNNMPKAVIELAKESDTSSEEVSVSEAIQDTRDDKQTPQYDQNDDKNCPKCSSPMIKRVAKKGKYVGNEFYGCSNFPRCRYIESNN